MATSSIVPVQPWQEVQVTQFGGPWSRLDPTSVPVGQALQSLNAEYQPGPTGFGSRFGFTPLFALSKQYTSLYNWVKAPDILSATGNHLIAYDKTDSDAIIIDLNSPTFPGPSILFSLSAECIDVASSGNFLFVAGVDATNQGTPIGVAQCRVATVSPGGFFVDKAFTGPFTTLPTLTNNGTGTVTAGQHFVGFLVTSRTGFTGLISPVVASGSNAGFPNQASSITAPGGKQIEVSLTATLPVEAQTISLVTTATTNQFQFFAVPGTNKAAVGGTSWTYTWTVAGGDAINLSDQALINNATDVSDNQFFLTQDSGGAGPFNPFKIVIYGQRTTYLTYDANGVFSIYVSELDQPQEITEQFNKLQLPGKLKGTCAFWLRQNLYVLGTNWTYSYQDNTGLPSTWAAATLVDGNIGTPSVEGVATSTSGDWVAVVHQSGLWIFNGTYGEKPLSFLQDDQWGRINWAAAQTIRISENHAKKQIAVVAPLDGATTPTHMLVFDYSDGLDYQHVKFSLWNFSGFAPRGLCVSQNNTTGKPEWLISPVASGSILRQMNAIDDTSPYTDNGAAIAFSQEIAPMPGFESAPLGIMFSFPGIYIRSTGKGIPQITAFGLDHVQSVQLSKAIVLSTKPGVEYWRQFYLRDEACTIKFVSGLTAGDYMLISGIRLMYYEYARRR